MNYQGGYWLIFIQKVEGVDGKPSTPEWETIEHERWDPKILI